MFFTPKRKDYKSEPLFRQGPAVEVMTKFEKVAAMAMQGFASSSDDQYGTPQEVAKDGIAAAHAFFNELEETE